jgi:hypothetical protein
MKLYVYISVILLFISIMYFNYNKEAFENNNNIVIIISRYNENLEWLKEEPFNKYPVIIYNKGPNDDFYKPDNLIKIVKLENVGREGHTYLYHIINEYNNLYNINILFPGSLGNENKKKNAITIINNIEEHNKAIFLSTKTSLDELYLFEIDNWISTDDKNKTINPENKLEISPIKPFGKWFEDNFKNVNLEYVSYNGILSVSKEDIIQHPKSHYEKLIKYLENSSNPEVGHYMERSWYAVFYPMNNTLIKN